MIDNFQNLFVKENFYVRNKSEGKNKWKYILMIPIIASFILLFNTEIIAQEKVNHLQHRYDGYTEIIHKYFTKKELLNIKNKFARQGIIFIYSGLKFNAKNEIIKITIEIKNKKSKSSAKWSEGDKPIPNIKVGEINGFVTITKILISI